MLAVLFLDLDNFKHINDSLGHSFGDQLLTGVASRLVAQVRQSDTVSRQGGDEFVLLMLEEMHAEKAVTAAGKILTSLAQPYHIKNHVLHVTTSIGISLYPFDGNDAETLIKNADAAMYHAKKRGKNNYQLFNSEMNALAVERQETEAELRCAIERDEFTLHYQPKVDLRSGRITGAEALIRWMHPHKGVVMPSEFIGIAEDCGLIIPIGRFVLQEACRQAKSWSGAPIQVSVNVSAPQFNDPHFVDTICTILDETGLEPRNLQLELTETLLMRNAEATLAALHAIKALGVQIAVDDFGTGYSNLSYLSQLPIDTLKIDQSFVEHIFQQPGNGVIVSAVISMGRNLKQRVIAEGVETKEQADFLNAHRCPEAQGYYFGRPLPPEQFIQSRQNRF